MELDLIARIAARTAVRQGVRLGIGDDAAVLDTEPVTCVSTDMLVEGRHFRREWTDFADLGHKALAVNLSDLAAMGASPVAATVALGVPPGLASDGSIERLYEGMEALAAAHEMTVAGGDVTGAPILVISVTVIGRMAPGVAPLLRSAARPGDVLCVTGALGGGIAALRVLEGRGAALPAHLRLALLDRHLRPVPRVSAGRVLAASGARAALDCSDGLALDARRMAEASGVAITIDLDRLPLVPGVSEVAAGLGLEPRMFAATGGDDYELVVALPPDLVGPLSARLEVPFTEVGQVESGPSDLRLLLDGKRVAPEALGWEHSLAE